MEDDPDMESTIQMIDCLKEENVKSKMQLWQNFVKVLNFGTNSELLLEVWTS